MSQTIDLITLVSGALAFAYESGDQGKIFSIIYTLEYTSTRLSYCH